MSKVTTRLHLPERARTARMTWSALLTGVMALSGCRPSAAPSRLEAIPLHSAAPLAEGTVQQRDTDPIYRYHTDSRCETRVSVAIRNYEDSVARRFARECAYRHDLGVRSLMQEAARSELRRHGRLAMDIPEYHDEQRLAGDVSPMLGPMAGIFASPNLGAFSQPWQFDAHPAPGVLVGFVVVIQQGSEPLPQSYQNLKLGFGVNCIYLEKLTVGPDAYQAWMVRPPDMPSNPPEKPTQQPCRDEHGAVPWTVSGPLKVVNSALAPFVQSDMVPAARFLEDNAGRTVFGVPCLNEWCQIGLPGFSPVTTTYCEWFTPGEVTCGTNREAKIASWYDEQRLEEMQGNTWIATNIRAAIVPEPLLDTRPSSFYTDVPRVVARIYLSANPPTTSKLFRAGLRRGENRVELVNGIANGRLWEFHITPITTPLGPGERPGRWKVLGPHRHYDAPVPGTVRFRFTIMDPGIWAPCGQYCCDSDGFT